MHEASDVPAFFLLARSQALLGSSCTINAPNRRLGTSRGEFRFIPLSAVNSVEQDSLADDPQIGVLESASLRTRYYKLPFVIPRLPALNVK